MRAPRARPPCFQFEPRGTRFPWTSPAFLSQLRTLAASSSAAGRRRRLPPQETRRLIDSGLAVTYIAGDVAGDRGGGTLRSGVWPFEFRLGLDGGDALED